MYKNLLKTTPNFTFPSMRRYYQCRLFSNELEPFPIEIDEEPQEEELAIDEGITG